MGPAIEVEVVELGVWELDTVIVVTVETDSVEADVIIVVVVELDVVEILFEEVEETEEVEEMLALEACDVVVD